MNWMAQVVDHTCGHCALVDRNVRRLLLAKQVVYCVIQIDGKRDRVTCQKVRFIVCSILVIVVVVELS